MLLQHASLAVRVEECLCSSKELCLDILEKETDMAVQCKPDDCDFEPLRDRLDHLEVSYEGAFFLSFFKNKTKTIHQS